jgi:hypothetical protein
VIPSALDCAKNLDRLVVFEPPSGVAAGVSLVHAELSKDRNALAPKLVLAVRVDRA